MTDEQLETIIRELRAIELAVRHLARVMVDLQRAIITSMHAPNPRPVKKLPSIH